MATTKKIPARRSPAPAPKKAATRAVRPAAPVKASTKAARTATRPAAAQPAAALPPAKVPASATSARSEKARKPKLVRDSFTIPKTEYLAIEVLKQRAAKAGAPAKKSEILRAGVMLLASMAEPAFLAAMRAVPAIKTGRPAKD